MTTYVMVSDLIMNGGEFCTILRRKPSEDYITIVEDDSTSTGSIEISHNDKTLFQRMKCDINDTPERWLTVVDLNFARWMLLGNKICSGCCNFDYCQCWLFKGIDIWNNYKAGSYSK